MNQSGAAAQCRQPSAGSPKQPYSNWPKEVFSQQQLSREGAVIKPATCGTRPRTRVAVHVVHRDVEVSHALPAVQVHGQHSVGARLGDDVGAQLGGDRLAALRGQRPRGSRRGGQAEAGRKRPGGGCSSAVRHLLRGPVGVESGVGKAGARGGVAQQPAGAQLSVSADGQMERSATKTGVRR